MGRRKQKMILVILMIVTILATDFFVLSSGIKTYASQLSSETNNPNIEFSAYFKEGENRVDSTEKSIKADDVRLYAEIKVENEGYLKEGTAIELENSNFNLKSEILASNTHIKSIEGNKVSLKQINSGETVEIELGIEPIIKDKIATDFLSKITTVKMMGSYVYSKSEEGQSIRTDKLVSINYIPDETTGAELETNIITNKILSVNGVNQRVVQVLVKSRIANNEYPVEQTTLDISVPNLGENVPEVNVLAVNEITKIKNTTTEDGITKIILSNEPNENNEISWNKNVWDEVVVTYIYPEEVDASKLEITTNSEVKVYNSENTYKGTHTAILENQEPNNVIIGKTKIITEELYKGNLYAKIEEQYNTKTSVVVTNTNVVDQIVVHEGPDTFSTAKREVTANTKYISTEINLEKMLNILGQDGNIEIKNGETTTTINKDTEANESGNIVINYENGAAELNITTSKPVKIGILELKHTKAITENNYTRAQLQTVKTLNARNTTLATLEGAKIVENTTEPATLELKETISKVKLTIENNKQTLSTTEANEVTLGITLVTDGVQYDLFKNSKMSIKFPTAVTNVELISTPSKQNANEFTVEVGKFNTTNKTMQINLSGEQTTYPKSELTQGYIQLNLKVTLDSLAIAQTDKIIMAYTNENAIQYDGERTDAGIVEQAVEISAPSQLIKMYNISSNENTSLTETILEQIDKKDAEKTIDFEISLINNMDSDISDLKIVGKLPTTENTISGQETNTLETNLKGILAENAKIYYTENTNPTSTDIENVENGWTENVTENANMYLIQLDTLARGANYTATITEQLPSSIEENVISYSQYGVIYDTETETEESEVSRKVGLATSEAANIKTEITAQVGQDILKSGDEIKEGEVIKYTVTVKNTGTKTFENVQLKLDVPEGTTYVRPIQEYILGEGTEYEQKIETGGYVYAENAYYEEITDTNKLNELTNIVISQLSTTEPYKIEYEVRVNKGAKDTNILNQAEVIYDGATVKSIEINNVVKEADVRVTIKKFIKESVQLLPGDDTKYMVYVENLTSTTLKNLELQIVKNGMDINYQDLQDLNGSENIIIDKLEANGIKSFIIYTKIHTDIDMINIGAVVKDSKKEKYRSNIVSEKIPYVKIQIDMESPQDQKVVSEGDIVEYNIDITNLGEIKNNILVSDVIPQFLQVQSISQNGEIQKQKTDDNDISNGIFDTVNIEPRETVKLNIKAKVQYISKMHNGKIITNTATAKVNEKLNYNSQIITHILKANKAQEKIENIICGYAWFDENENGRRDAYEQTMPEINVKLYDMKTNAFVSDENGNILKETTDNKGEYSFSNINNGKYLVVFEFDTEKYEFTTKYAEGVDTSLNSKADLNKVSIINGEKYVVAIEIEDLKTNMFNMNIGLKEIKEDNPSENIPDEPSNPEEPTNPEEPENINNKKTIRGFAWLDSNRDGKKDKEETNLSGIKVRIYNVNKNDYLRDENNNILETITDNDGKYILNNIEKGDYKLLFEYDTEKYEPTLYMVEGADSAIISKVIANTVNINGQEEKVAVTDTINVQDNIFNINIGLKEKLTFDLELEKYISRVVVQNSKGAKTYNYAGSTFAKVEINKKQLNNTLVVIEYTIKVKNNGDISGYVTNIVDYLPNGLTFNSELNKDWYILENNLHTKSLEKTELKPGEEKEIKLVLTKVMNTENVGLINNRAEIYEDYNKYGEADIDSKPNNQSLNEDDMNVADIIIGISTGGSIIAYIVLFIINIMLITFTIYLLIKNNIINIPSKAGRR